MYPRGLPGCPGLPTLGVLLRSADCILWEFGFLYMFVHVYNFVNFGGSPR